MTVHRPFDLGGRVALVTGAARGIGRATALSLARAGAAVAVHYHRAGNAARETVAAIEAQGGRGIAVGADITDAAAVEAMIARAVAALGEMDILVNNAGVHAASPLLETTEADFDRVVAINVTGAFLCARAVAPGMCARRHGRIIGISSDCGKRGGAVSGVHFSASKAALQGLTRSLARQLAPFGVTANDVAPSMIETERWHETLAPAAIAARAARVPARRLGHPGDVAAAVLYLASDEAGFVTGASIDVAGGGYIG